MFMNSSPNLYELLFDLFCINNKIVTKTRILIALISIQIFYQIVSLLINMYYIQIHRIVEPGRDSAQAELLRGSCPGLCSYGFWVSPRMETP